MTITEHKRLTALIPEDLTPNDKAEFSNDGEKWIRLEFDDYCDDGWLLAGDGQRFRYARRPATSADWPNSLERRPEWLVRPIIKGRLIVTEEYLDGAMVRRKVEMPDEGIVMVRQ